MKNNLNRVEYSQNALTISIQTSCPEATHASLMQGLITSLQQNITAAEKIPGDEDGLLALAGLLKVLVPTERALAVPSYTKN